MSSKENERRSPLAVWLVAAAALLLPVAYVVSMGPALWLADHGYLSESALVVYSPALFLRYYCPPLRDATDAYLRMWVDWQP